jgi:hypothetical protein
MNDLENTSKSLIFERAPPKLLMVVVISVVMLILSANLMIVSRYYSEVSWSLWLAGGEGADGRIAGAEGDETGFEIGLVEGRFGTRVGAGPVEV